MAKEPTALDSAVLPPAGIVFCVMKWAVMETELGEYTVLYENACGNHAGAGDPHSFFSDMTSQHRITTTHANLRLQIQDLVALTEYIQFSHRQLSETVCFV
jgi:hypothetical protein